MAEEIRFIYTPIGLLKATAGIHGVTTLSFFISEKHFDKTTVNMLIFSMYSIINPKS